MNSFRQLIAADALKNILRDIGVSTPDDKVYEYNLILSEYLRRSLYRLSFEEGGQKEFAPVHIRRLINTVSGHLKVLWSELEKEKSQFLFKLNNDNQEITINDEIKWVLERIALLGDCMHIGNGFWLPTPIKLVQLPQSNETIIIGGFDTQSLKSYFPSVRIAGYGRFLLNKEIPFGYYQNKNWWQDYQNWLGWIPKDLHSWTQEKINCINKEGSLSSSTFLDFEVFVSTWAIKNRVRQSWIPFETFLGMNGTETVMLCRTKKPTRYFLGVFEKARMVRELAIQEQDIARWLMVGLRIRHGLKPYARWKGNNLTVYPPLPFSLERHLTIYACKLLTRHKGNYYVPKFFHGNINKFLHLFGYEVKQTGGD
ncbi:hypothetical protein [Aneurinibacillus tyrosinisolvens]|uniref:hypothetical protein n=1 Tax=Aneurinibacillus tyrosinisolvens TaxID=1443435 RepID=UPI00063EFCA2|nr:hypothetical protein [Aneurinibacillus tyrosinisolvens]